MAVLFCAPNRGVLFLASVLGNNRHRVKKGTWQRKHLATIFSPFYVLNCLVLLLMLQTSKEKRHFTTLLQFFLCFCVSIIIQSNVKGIPDKHSSCVHTTAAVCIFLYAGRDCLWCWWAQPLLRELCSICLMWEGFSHVGEVSAGDAVSRWEEGAFSVHDPLHHSCIILTHLVICRSGEWTALVGGSN